MLRLPIKHIFRAFPELDSYSDEQCARFVRATRSSLSMRLLRALAIGFVMLLATAISFAVVTYLHLSLLDRSRTLAPGSPLLTWYGLLLNILIMLVACSAPPIGGFLTRDFLLIRRIRYILRTRGVCFSCRYTLVGLTVGENLIVTCPECGMTTTVDPALGELTTDPDGRARFRPDPARHRQPRLFTQARLARLKRAAPWIAASIIGVPLLLAGSYEGFIRWQASVARQGRVGPNAMDDLVASRQPPGTTRTHPNAIELLTAAVAVQAELDLDHWYDPGSPLNPDAVETRDLVSPEYRFIRKVPKPPTQRELDADFDDNDARAEKDREYRIQLRSREIALAMMDVLEQSEYFRLMEKAVHAPRDDRSFAWLPDTPLELQWSSTLQGARLAANILSARSLVALQSGDRERYIASTRDGLALARLMMRQPVQGDYLSGVACEALIMSSIRSDLAHPLPPDWLEAIGALVDNHQRLVTHGQWTAGMRLEAIDTISFIFSDPDSVRFGRWSSALAPYAGPGLRLGTYHQNIREVEAQVKRGIELRTLSLKEAASATPRPERLMLATGNAWTSLNVITIEHRSRMIVRGIRTMIALERYRNAHGDVPPTLEALVPDWLEALPIDPWSDAPLRYTRVDSAQDRLGRSYLLYSIASDFIDNRGKEFRSDYIASPALALPARPEFRGYDFVINADNW